MSKLKEFRDNLIFLADTARKPLIWIETFDYNYIIDTLGGVGNTAIWNNASQHVTNINGEKQTSKTLELGALISQFSEGKFKAKENAENNSFLENANILVAQVSEYLFEEDGLKHESRLVAKLQDFVYRNNKEEERAKRKTIVIISPYHFDVPGLNHLYERLTLPMLDNEDIDIMLGFTTYINRDYGSFSETFCIRNRNIVKKTQIAEHVEEEIIKIDDRPGVIIRDEQNKVLDFLISEGKRLKYPFGPDILDSSNFTKNYQTLTDALSGMHLMDIMELLNSLKIKGGGQIIYDYDDKELPVIISDRKKQIANNSGLLEVVDYDDNYFESVADIEKILAYVDKEKERIEHPSKYPPQLPKPKGILLVGAPGCGKSESAKAIASKLNKPLYRLNIGSLLGHKYGQSENKFIEALRTADASAPCVLWIDEIEKAFAGAGNESENDDTLTHIVGHFLTWMQEHKTMVYLVATANDLSRMKPEMLRKGRWDERFYLSYPSQKGCEKIIYAISQKKLKTRVSFNNSDVFEPEGNDYIIKEEGSKNLLDILTKLMNAMQMSGAEIENVIVKTIANSSFYKDRQWCVDLKSIGFTILDDIFSLKYCHQWVKQDKKNEFTILRNRYITKNKLEKFLNEELVEMLNEVINICDNGNEVDYFLKKQVDAGILDAQIKRCEKWGDSKEDKKKRENLYSLLLEKYREQYCFTPAN